MTVWDNLSQSQRDAVMHEDGPSAVYAGPGSGKTRVVTLRAVRLAQQGRRTLVTTFTSDATQEMKARIAAMAGAEAMAITRVTTVHAYCLQLLRINGLKSDLLTDEFRRKSIAEVAHAGDLEGGVSVFLNRMSYAKNTGHTADKYKHDGSYEDMEFARVWRAYEKEKLKKTLIEFDDLVLRAAAMLESDEEVRTAAAAQFTHIIVDECQDMNAPQYGVVFSLARDHQNVMLVGDLDQSLYGFRGADTVTFKRFAAQPRVKVYELPDNYRCTRRITAFADSLIRQDADRRHVAFRSAGPEGAPVTWERFGDPDIEALAVGDALLRLHGAGMRWRDAAVLYRTNAQAEAIERNFSALEIPYTIRDDGDFYGRKEVQGLLAYLNFFAGDAVPGDAGGTCNRYADEWLLALLNVPNRKIARLVGSQLKNMADIRGKRIWAVLPEFHADDLRTHRALREVTHDLESIEAKLQGIAHAGEAIRAVRTVTGFDEWLRREAGQCDNDSDNDRLQNVQRVQSAAAHYRTIREYLDAVDRVRAETARRKAERAKKRREQDEVCLSTGHSAKGLEWSCVFAIGWSEEILPHRKAEDISEERRIGYVIATRARDCLHISSLDTWNDAVAAPSRFLTGLNLAASEPRTGEIVRRAAEDAPGLGGLFVP